MVIALKVTIASIDVTDYIKSFSVEQTVGEAVVNCEILVPNTIASALTLTNGQTVIVWRNLNGVAYNDVTDPNDRIFKGYIETYFPEGGRITLKCKDQLGLAMRKTYSAIYLDTGPTAGKISEIFKDLLTQAGLSYSAGSIQDSGTVQVLSKFRCVNSYVFERLQKLADMLQWQFYYRSDTDLVYFEPEGYSSNANVIQTGNILQKIKWEYDTKDMVNDLTVIGAKQLVTKNPDETFNGDGVTKIFTLLYSPEDIKVTVGGVAQKCGIKSSGTALQVYIDKQRKQIEFVIAPISGTNNVVVNYTYNAPIPVRMFRQVSVDTYGRYQKEMTLMDVGGIDDATNRANKILDKYSEPFKYATVKISNHNLYGIRAGQIIRINDEINVVDNYFVIQKFTQRYPFTYDEVQVGEKEKDLARFIAQLSDKTKKLEEEEYRDTDILSILVQGTAAISVIPKQLKVTRMKVNDSLIYGHPDDNGKYGRGIKCDEFETTPPSWTPTNAAVARSNTQYIVGSYSMQVTPSATSVTLVSTQAFGDLSSFLTNTTGVVGLWVYVTATTDVSSIVCRIGSSAGNYSEITGTVFGDGIWYAGWNYVIFRLSTGTITGTPNWTSVAYERFVITVNGSLPIIYLDYNTVGTGDKIALNGYGDRRTASVVETTVY